MKNGTDMDKLIEQARAFFEGIADAPALRDELREQDHEVQFMPLQGSAFHAAITNGKATFGEGEAFAPESLPAIYIVEVQDCLRDLFAGRTTIGEAIFHHRIRIPGYRNKEPRIAALSRIMRLGVWQLVPGAEILRPVK